MADHFVNVRIENDRTCKALITNERDRDDNPDGDDRRRVDLWIVPTSEHPAGRILENVPLGDSDDNVDAKGRRRDEVHHAWPLDHAAPDQDAGDVPDDDGEDGPEYPGLERVTGEEKKAAQQARGAKATPAKATAGAKA